MVERRRRLEASATLTEASADRRKVVASIWISAPPSSLMSINVVLWPLLAAWRGPLPAPQRAGEPQMSIKMTVSLLQKCNSDAARLAKMLSKDQLKSECEARSLRVTGTKSELAPRLRIFKETAARNLVPEALTPETYGLEVRFNSILIPF